MKIYKYIYIFFFVQFIFRFFLSYHLPAAEIEFSRRIVFCIMGTLADSFILLVNYLFYSIFKKKIFSISYCIWYIYSICVSIINNILLLKTFSIIEPSIILLILDNLNLQSIKAVFGEFYVLYIVFVFLIILFCFKVLYDNLNKENININTKIKVLLTIICILGGYFCFPGFPPQNNKSAYDLRMWIWQPATLSTYNLFNYRKDLDIQLHQYQLSDIDIDDLDKMGLIYEKNQNVESVDFDKIVLIIVESLDRNYINCYNENIPCKYTEFFNYAVDNYISMDNFYTASTSTDNGINALLNSRLDYYTDRIINQNDKYKVNSLLDVVNNHGYDTYFIRGSSKKYADHDLYYPKLFGMNKFITSEDFYEKYGLKNTQWGIEDKFLFNEAIKILCKARSKKQFIVINTIDTHPPYRNYDNQLSSNKFLDSLAHTDYNLKKFYEKIKLLNLFDDKTLIIITADHSATHGANYTNRLDFEPDRIPLIFLTKNIKFNEEFKINVDKKRYCSQIDLAPTIIDILGFIKPDSMMGKSIFTQSSLSITKYRDSLYLRNNKTMKVVNLDNDIDDILYKWYYHYY